MQCKSLYSLKNEYHVYRTYIYMKIYDNIEA